MPSPATKIKNPAANTPYAAARWTRALAVAALVGLVLLGLAWELWLAPLRPGGSWWALKIIPLLPALPGLLRYRMRTYRWLALLIWLYFAEGVVRATSEAPPSAWLAAIEAALSLLLFVVCTAHVRLRQRHARTHAAHRAP